MVRHVRVGLHLFNQARYEGLRPPSALLLEEVEVLLEQGVGGLGHLDFSLDLAALDDLFLSASLEGTSIGSFSAEVPPDLSFVGRMSDSL